MNIAKIKIIGKNCKDKEYSYLVLIHAKKHFLCQHCFKSIYTSLSSNVDESFLSKELSGVDYNYVSEKAHDVSISNKIFKTSNGRFFVDAFDTYANENYGLPRYWDDIEYIDETIKSEPSVPNDPESNKPDNTPQIKQGDSEPLSVGRHNLVITSAKVIEDADGQPQRLLVNFKAEAPAGFVVPPTSFSLKHEAGKEALTNLLYAAGCREPIGLPDFLGLCLSGSLYMDEEGWPTWGNWEPTK